MSGPTSGLPEQSDSGEYERLGRFSLLRVAGRGASATVYEALDTRMERPVALKVLSFDPLLTPEQRQRQIERFEREARAVARLSHPNIVSVYDVGEAMGKHFLVMELLSGVTLRERIEQGGPIALGEATSIVEQIASALDCTHAEGIVHRDIKPSNILLLPDGRVKMLDFGIARRGEDATVTHTGMLIGSPAYMSPEQGRGENASPASDIWALGALLYEMLAGQSPFGASNVAAVLYKAAYDSPTPLPEDVSRAQVVVDHALAKQPEERYASAGALANALRAAVEHSSVHHNSGATLPSASSPTKQSLKDAAASAYVSASAQSPADESVPLMTAEGTAETPARPRLRVADFGVVAAWGAVVISALAIVTVRMRQAGPAAPVSSTKSSTAPSPNLVLVAPGAVLPATKPAKLVSSSQPAPSATPSPAATFSPVRIVEMKPTPAPASKATASATAKPLALPSPSPGVAKTVVRTAAISKSFPKPTASVRVPSQKPVKAADASAERPWDDRIDRLGDPEPEPTTAQEPTATPPRRQPEVQTQDDSDKGSAVKPLFKPSVLLGRWQGNIWKRGATLQVQSSDNDSFQGTLTLKTEKGLLRFPVQGSFSPVTGRLSFWSSGSPAEATAAKIDMGQENGKLLSSKTMGGIGVDSDRRVFTWSFSR